MEATAPQKISIQRKGLRNKTIFTCFGNVSKDFTGSNGYVYDFLVDNNVIEGDDIINIHNYLIKKYDIK